MSILTGHTAVHEPHSVDAKGREAYFCRSRPGVRIEPMGPGTVEP